MSDKPIHPSDPSSGHDSFPTPNADGWDQNQNAHSPMEFGPWPGRLLIILLVAASVPILQRGIYREVGRWHIAAATDASYRGDHETALKKIDQAIAWDPDQKAYHFRKTGVLLKTGDAKQAAIAADHFLEETREKIGNGKSGQGLLAMAINQSAYAHALDNSKLLESLAAMDEAIDLQGDKPDPGHLDTRGYLKYLIATDATLDIEEFEKDAHLEQAVKDLEQAVEENERVSKILLREYRRNAREVIDQAPIREASNSVIEGRAVLFQHRGLIYQAVGRTAEAEKDFDRAKKLGFDPAQGVW